MKISGEWLNEKSACSEAVLEMIHQEKYLDWGNWLIVRTMTRPQYLAYAIFAAEQVIDIFEKKYPDDNRPRLAIEAAKAVLKNDNKKTRAAAWAAWAAGAAAWEAAWAAARSAAGAAARSAAWEAAGAAREAAWAAWAAGAAAWEAAGAAWEAAGAAAWEAAGAAAKQKMQIKILRYGLELLKEPT